MFKIEIHKALSITIISLALSYIAFELSLIPIAFLFATFLHSYTNSAYIYSSIAAILNVLFIFLLFKIKRFKNGFSFLNNDYLNIVVVSMTIIIIFIYALFYNRYTYFNTSVNYLYILLLFIVIISFILIKQAFIIYQKLKLQNQTLKDYEKELGETNKKLQTALEEKDKIVKSNHEFYHRQEALKNKLDSLTSSAFNSEISEEISAINTRIDNLSNEYSNKTQILHKLTSTGITEIDDMLSYFQKECNENNIELLFKLDCNINKIVDSLISRTELETLLGDLLRNSIIAINHSENKNRSIMVVLGIKDNFYELDIFDSGIPFEIETLINLGLEKCSTHLDEGGTGIGFITTFETLQNNKASLIITEFNQNTYIKCIGIRFDNKNQYTINSTRTDLIESKNIHNREIIFNTK
jgi:hypothetical protein